MDNEVCEFCGLETTEILVISSVDEDGTRHYMHAGCLAAQEEIDAA